MSIAFPDHVDPWRAVRQRLACDGEIALDKFPRLASVLAGTAQTPVPVHYRLCFERDREGRALVLGHVGAGLRVPCQRCLGTVEIAVDVPLRLALLNADQSTEDLPEDLDPLVVTADSLNLATLIEDELLLAIPVVPRHEEGLCQPPEHALTGASSGLPKRRGGVTDLESRRDSSRKNANPFAALAAIRGVDPVDS